MERGIQIKGSDDPDPRAFDTDAVLVSQEEIEEQVGQAKIPNTNTYLWKRTIVTVILIYY